MEREKILFTSESVTEGHPDKMCDQISDAILDELMKQDPMSRVACETCCTTGVVMVMGEITTKAYVDIPKIVRDTVREIGYTRGKYGFDADTCGVITTIDEQSSDIAMGVDKALEAKENKMSEDDIEAIGAGDQGMMFGYASDETEEYMPYPAAMAHKLARRLTEVRKNGTLPYLRPDGKTQVTVEYDENGVPKRLDAVVLSTQHDPEVTQERIHEDIKKYVFDEVIPANMTDDETKFFINPTGRFVIGGPQGDAGLTGRKIIVDSYGGLARHGGGAFSGKDYTKVEVGYAGLKLDVNITVSESEPVIPEALEVVSAPAKTEYEEGEMFNPAGLSVKIKYSDGSYGDEVAYGTANADQFTFNPTLDTALKTSDEKVTVTYAEKTADIKIKVNKKTPVVPENPTVEKVEIKANPAKTEYKAGETFDPSGLVLTVTMSDGTTKVVAYGPETAKDFSFNPSLNTKLTADTKKVTVTYGGQSADVAVSVKADPSEDKKPVDPDKKPNTEKPDKGGAVQTGDNFNVTLLIGLVVLAGVTAGGTALTIFKRNKRK